MRPVVGAERGLMAWALCLIGLCCVAIAWATWQLERTNARRAAQLEMLGALAGDPAGGDPGPVRELDGLYGQSLCRVETGYGMTLAFQETVR